MVVAGNGSFFEYNITRPYPFKHFTLIAVLLTALWLAIITVLNVLSQGYTIITTYSTDWTGSTSRGQWYESILARSRDSCQPRLFEVGEQFRSNYSGMLYTLAGFRSLSFS